MGEGEDKGEGEVERVCVRTRGRGSCGRCVRECELGVSEGEAEHECDKWRDERMYNVEVRARARASVSVGVSQSARATSAGEGTW